MTVVLSKTFRREFEKLPMTIRKKVERQLRHLAENIKHPSLKARKMEGVPDVWEARIDIQYRMTFQLHKEVLVLRRVGTHSIYQKP